LPHPPQELPYRNDGYGDFVLSVGRLDRAKRNDLLLEAAALDPGLRVVIAGEGPDRDRLESLAAERGLNGRAEFPGRVDEVELASLYARCLAVYYAPVDEDFGMVPYEAFLSEKPVLTTTDAGGPLEVVTDGRTGYVTSPNPAELARAAGRLREHPDDARAYGLAGKELAARVTWDSCIQRLLA
jgi:glycosyltransferase involved in cell wall biosynthesis